MDELKKQYGPVIKWIVDNFKNYINNDSINIEELYNATVRRFPLLTNKAIGVLVEKISLQIEIDSISSGIAIEDIKVKVCYRKDEK